MTNLVQNLEQCWYIFPPWGQRIPPLLVNLLERSMLNLPKHSVIALVWSGHNM